MSRYLVKANSEVLDAIVNHPKVKLLIGTEDYINVLMSPQLVANFQKEFCLTLLDTLRNGCPLNSIV